MTGAFDGMQPRVATLVSLTASLAEHCEYCSLNLVPQRNTQMFGTRPGGKWQHE